VLYDSPGRSVASPEVRYLVIYLWRTSNLTTWLARSEITARASGQGQSRPRVGPIHGCVCPARRVAFEPRDGDSQRSLVLARRFALATALR